MGQMVKFGRRPDCGYIVYPYGLDGKEMLSIVGLGKRGSFPILSSKVSEVRDQESYLSKFHREDSFLWVDKTGTKFYYTTPAHFESKNGDLIAKGPNIYFKYRVILNGSEVEYLDREDVGFCYQLDDLILIQRDTQEISDLDLKSLIEGFNKESLKDILELPFVELEVTDTEDIYLGLEKYFIIKK